MKTKITAMLFASLTAAACAADAKTPALVPAPQKWEPRDGVFQIQPATRILVDSPSREAGRFLAETLRPATGYPLRVGTSRAIQPVSGAILLTTRDANAALGQEGYALTVAPDRVVIRAPGQAGLFYGAQTLRQLLPPAVFATQLVAGAQWTVPCVQIEDQPRFRWRGLMLDVSRHFFSPAEIKRVLDLLALHKVNTFHWHLVDDHGWRIQIKKYPKLTEVGAWRNGVGFGFAPTVTTAYGRDGRYGGFYTQKEILEIVAYAQARNITIVPEIEMPGHSTAALAAYPRFSCTGGPYTPELKGGVFHGVYCAGNDETFSFLHDVLGEVCALFPGGYVHIGGDEVPKDRWKQCPKCQARLKAEGLKDERELQSWFIRRIEKFVNARGKNLIGWSEIREGGLAQNAAVMDWIGGAVEAASGGHDVVMSPTDFCYLDHYQSRDQAGAHLDTGPVMVQGRWVPQPSDKNPEPKDSDELGQRA